MTVVQKPANMDFEKELVNRFFNPRSYFFLCVSEHLRDRRPLDEPGAEEEYALVAALMDHLVNAEDTREELKKLATAEPFAEYLRILEESVERFRREALPPPKLKAAIENVAVLFLDATLACLEDSSCRNKVLDYLEIQPEELEAGPASPDVAFVGEKALEPEPVEARFEEEAFLASYFRNNVLEEFRKVDEVPEQAGLKRAKAYLTAFYNVRDLAMIHGEEDVEALSGKMAELLRRELARGEPRPEVLSLADRVRKFIEDNLSRWGDIDGEQVRVLVGILQDALLGQMPEIVMAVELEEPEEPSPEAFESELEATAEAREEPRGQEFVGADFGAEPHSAETEEQPSDVPLSESGEAVANQPFEPQAQEEPTSVSQAPPEAGPHEGPETKETPVAIPAESEAPGFEDTETESLVFEENPESPPEAPEEESRDQATAEESPEKEKTTPEFGFAEMIGIEEFLDLDEEAESVEAAPEPPTPAEEHEAAAQAEAFLDSFAPVESQATNEPAASGEEEDEFRLPGEDDEELLALIREVRRHSEESQQAHTAEPEQAPDAAESLSSERADRGTAATTRLGYGPHAQEAALYLRVMRSALSALQTDPAKRSALEDLDLAASSLKNVLRKLGDTKLWAVPAALSAAATVLMETGGSAGPDFLEATHAALELLESGPAPALNGKINEVVEQLTRLQTSGTADDSHRRQSQGDSEDADALAERPPFRLRGRRSVQEHKQATGF